MTRASRAEGRSWQGPVVHVDGATWRTIPGPAGDLRLRVVAGERAEAVYVHVHGGGWALGAADQQDGLLQTIADAIIALEAPILNTKTTVIRAFGHKAGVAVADWSYDYLAASEETAGTFTFSRSPESFELTQAPTKTPATSAHCQSIFALWFGSW